ncbi:NAD-glutamate dehydrogenase domain-containing protein [Methylocucumis oryzae]|uniref:NAD-glutamate dehydrogenase domain-containing protein n=1 Tax=Methylocucumis oryzae TaxID=1632867 RepID=UPI000A88329A
MVQATGNHNLSLDAIEQPLLETIQAVMGGRLESDSINKLVTLTGLNWQACDVLRTYRNYYLQLDHHTSKTSIHQALINNHQVAKGLFEYFEARFRPNPAWRDSMVREEQVLYALRLQLLEAMAAVENLNEDRILRTFFNLIDATVRSNFHQRNQQDDYFIAIKIDSLGVIDMPSPKPIYEIYVHAVNMEGIHLRGGKVSRGGIRWSDRIDDFRTEILGLMQTQISKNALIIPTGAKGGFVVKLSPTHPQFREAGKLAYMRFMRGLLDLTDNYCGDQIISPQQVVAHDDYDPYLVVAADKGTAKFSDIANGISADYQFWLGDAFASGGSHGYDHKALGITARGAWECVKRHFRELGKDIQNQPFTVIGIGSMDGDVFGNGMLQSPQIRLLAAF